LLAFRPMRAILVSMDFFALPVIDLKLLFVFLILAYEQRSVLLFNVTHHPTADWAAQQLRLASQRTPLGCTEFRSEEISGGYRSPKAKFPPQLASKFTTQSQVYPGSARTRSLDILLSYCEIGGYLERETGFEPATSTLARLHSTTELFPLP
jgi:hypothetical protein